MSEESDWIKSEWKEIILYLFIGVFLALVVPTVVGLVWKGYEESFVKGQALTFGSYLTNFTIYIPFLIIALLNIIFPLSRLFWSDNKNDHPAIKKNPSWFRIFTVSELYAPEENGALWKLSEHLGFKGRKRNFMRWSLNPLRVLVASIVLFGFWGIFLVANPQMAVSGVPQLQLQQVTIASEVTFSSFVPAFAENGVLMFILMLLMGINAWLCAKFRLGYGVFFAIAILLICPFIGFTWGGFHSITYGNSDASFWGTVVFGLIGALITVLLGIWIPFFIWHIMNNMFITLSKLVTRQEDIILLTFLILIFILAIWIGIELKLRKMRKRNRIMEVSIPSE